jgi:hypothetical protein
MLSSAYLAGVMCTWRRRFGLSHEGRPNSSFRSTIVVHRWRLSVGDGALGLGCPWNQSAGGKASQSRSAWERPIVTERPFPTARVARRPLAVLRPVAA